MKILVAEDEPLMLKTIELRLRKDGHQVLLAQDGREALLAIDAEAPDLVISEIMMPFSSGLEIVSRLRACSGRYIPVIILSGMGQEKTVLEAFNLGADDFITKPFSPNELSMRIRKLAIRSQDT